MAKKEARKKAAADELNRRMKAEDMPMDEMGAAGAPPPTGAADMSTQAATVINDIVGVLEQMKAALPQVATELDGAISQLQAAGTKIGGATAAAPTPPTGATATPETAAAPTGGALPTV